MIEVITGQPRNGKSQFAVSLIFKYIEENSKREDEGKPPRHIFSDIEGINDPETITKLPSVEPMPKQPIWFDLTHNSDGTPKDIPEGYFVPPEGSIFFFDECHKRDFVRADGKQLSTNPSTITLNEHGHADHIIYFMTQFPTYIHKHIQGLVQYHYHCKRPHGLKYTNIYKWDEFKTSPRTDKAKKSAIEINSFKFKKKYQDAYKSASAHDSIKIKLPSKVIIGVATLCILIPFVIMQVLQAPLMRGWLGLETPSKTPQPKSENTSTKSFQESKKPQHIPEKPFETPKHEEELKQIYLTQLTYRTAHYDSVRPAMIIETQGKCRVTNMYGEKLRITQSTCKTLSERPQYIPRSRQKYANMYDSMPAPPTSNTTQTSKTQVKLTSEKPA